MSSFYMPCFLISFYCRKYVTPAKIYCFLRCSEICTYWRTQRQGRSMNVRTKSYLYQELCIHILLIKYLYIPQIYLLSPSYRQGRAEEFFLHLHTYIHIYICFYYSCTKEEESQCLCHSGLSRPYKPVLP